MGERPMEARAKHPATAATTSRRLLLCLSFFLGGLREPDAPVAGARGLLLCAGEVGRARQWAQGRRRHRLSSTNVSSGGLSTATGSATDTAGGPEKPPHRRREPRRGGGCSKA